MNGKQVLKQLKAAGWNVVRIKGSHHMVYKDGQLCPVPVHGTADLASGTLAKIARITGVKFSK